MSNRQATNHQSGERTTPDLSHYTVVALFPLFLAGYAIAIGTATLLGTGAAKPTIAVMVVGFVTVLIAIAAIGRGGTHV